MPSPDPEARIARVALGTLSLRAASERDFRGILDRFFAAGGEWVDTASFYGDGDVERRLGAYLRSRALRPRLCVKVGHFRSASDYRCARAVREAVSRSVERLGCEPAAVMLHEADWGAWWEGGARPGELAGPGATFEAGAPAWEAVREEAASFGAKRGISGNNAPVLERALARLDPDVVLVAKQMDLLWRSAGSIVGEAARRDVWLGSPFHQGWLFRLPELTSAPGPLGEAAGRLALLLARGRTTVERTAIPFLLDQAPDPKVVVGVDTIEQLEAALSSATTVLDRELLDALKEVHHFGGPMQGPLKTWEETDAGAA
jgi:aryl-alcohol dehydrogenase-like predicted oxidoreductase